MDDTDKSSQDIDPLAPTPEGGEDKGTLSSNFGESLPAEEDIMEPSPLGLPVFFGPKDFDIYINKVTLDAYIFHGQKLEHDIERLDYDHADQSIVIVKKDGKRYDLGTKVQWLIRSYFRKLNEIAIVQTKDGESIDGFMVPIHHLNRAEN